METDSTAYSHHVLTTHLRRLLNLIPNASLPLAMLDQFRTLVFGTGVNGLVAGLKISLGSL